MKYRYERLEARCRDYSDYDHHAIHGLVDEAGRPILGVFIHREGKGVVSESGKVATSGGGIRWRPNCGSLSDQAYFIDGLRLSGAMSEKSAGLDVPLGGAKTVVFGQNIPGYTTDENGFCTWPWEVRDELWEAFATQVLPNTPGYVTAEDVGTKVADAACIKKHAPWAFVAGVTQETDSSPTTSRGMIIGLKVVLQTINPAFPELRDASFAIQGVGGVGGPLLDLLYAAGARNIAFSEPRDDVAEKYLASRKSVRRIGLGDIHEESVDVFLPCALGGSINEQSIDELGCFAVAGCANNQLATPEMGVQLDKHNILYAPDYIINAGGMVQVICSTITGGSVDEMLERIGRTLQDIFAESKSRKLPTSVVADELVAARMSDYMKFPA